MPGGGAAVSGPPTSSTPVTTGWPGDLPCDVALVLSGHCVSCHGATPRMGAPVTLLTAAEFQAIRNGISVGSAALMRVQNPARPMPPAPNPLLSPADIATLQRWIDAGTPATNPGCGAEAPVVTPPAGGTGGTAPPPPMGGTGGTAGSAPDAGTIEPPEPSTEWTSFGHDLDNTRSNAAETQLSPASVSGLHQLWAFTGASTTSAPAIAGGVVYLPTWDGKVHALRADDGGELWTATLPDLIDSSPAVTATRVFVSDDNGSVHALDRETGMKQWSHLADMHAEAHLWSSPVVIEDAGILVVGVASGEEAVTTNPKTFRGSVVALDLESGMERWRFYTTDNDATSGPGIGVWGTAAVDTGRKLVFIGTGNNYAAPSGPYSDSMLAINYETGMLAWSTQFTEGDVFTVFGGTGPDFDIGSSANLFSAGGQDLVGIGVKSGNYFALDRDAGTIVWMAQLSPGGSLGGVMSATAFADGIVYGAANDQRAGKTVVFALHAENGTMLWTHDTPMTTYGGVAHANGVLYVGTIAGNMLALDAASGNELWSDQTQDSIAGSPVVSAGKLLVPWGYTWTLREGPAGSGGLIAYGL